MYSVRGETPQADSFVFQKILIPSQMILAQLAVFNSSMLSVIGNGSWQCFANKKHSSAVKNPLLGEMFFG